MTNQMLAAVWHGMKDVRVEQVPVPPSPPAGQVKIKVACTGICGTDLHEYDEGPVLIPTNEPHPMTGIQAPVILGHEIAGTVVETGADVTRVSEGDRVAICPLIGCQKCRWCQSGLMGVCPNLASLGLSWSSGAFASYINVYDYMCYQLPGNVSDECGALVEPFAATVRALRIVDVQPGDNVAVVGSGPIGLMVIQAAHIAGAKQIIAIEPADNRRKLARTSGATSAIDPLTQDAVESVQELTEGEGADIVVECVGRQETGLLAGSLARRKGRIMIMGVFVKPAPMDYTDIVFSEKTFMGSMGGYGVYDDAIQMMAEGKFNSDALITGRIPLDKIVPNGFEALIHHKEEHVKILVTP